MTQQCLACDNKVYKSVQSGWCSVHARSKSLNKTEQRRLVRENFIEMCIEKWNTHKHKCRYCDKKINSNDVTFYDPQFNELVHQKCLRDIREDELTVVALQNLKIENKENMSDYIVWLIPEEAK